MNTRALPLLALGLGLGLSGCAQDSAPLPFDPGATATTRTIAATGGTISLAAGASIQFPAGALASPTELSLSVASDAPSVAGGGTVASAWYRIEPATVALAQEAEADIAFDPGVDRDRAWLASLVSVTPGGVRELADTRVDFSTGIASAGIRSLGSIAVVIPAPAAVVAISPLGSTAAPSAPSPIARQVGTDSVDIRCGTPEVRCSGVTIQASGNLLDKVARAAVVYPSIRGGLRFHPATSTLRGRIGVDAQIRALLKSGVATANVPLDIDDFVINQRISLPSAALAGTGEAAQATGSGAVLITITETVRVANASGGTEDATVSISFPVQLF